MMCWRNGVLVNWKNDDLFSEAVSLERLVVKIEIDVFVVLVAVVLGKAAGRAEQNEQDGEGTHHRQRQMLTSSSPPWMSSAPLISSS